MESNLATGILSGIERMAYVPPIPQFVINAEQGVASEFYRRLVEWINDFDDSLDKEHEVGVRLVSFGHTSSFT